MASAAYGMVLCGTDEMEYRYRGRIEKVKFGVPVDEAFSPDIPATLLVLLLKVNKEGPLKKDIWRAPGNQAQVRKLSHIMRHGRLVNISNISVYTAASVIKRFLAKLPGGIFGEDNEKQLFDAFEQPMCADEQREELFCRIVTGLPVPCQHLLVLLFGTFRLVIDSAESFGSRMTPDAIGISVAPSLFHTCIHDKQKAKMEDVLRFKLASQVISRIIQSFGHPNLFPRECYEFYARITGRTLRVDEHWQFSFQPPSRTLSQPSIRRERPHSPEAASSSREREEEREEEQPSTSLAAGVGRTSSEEYCEDEDVYGESLPELGRYAPRSRRRDQSRSLEDPSKVELREQRLSTSMAEVVVHSEEESEHSREYLESTRSLTYLEWVHERQTRRMKTRSEWFLSPALPGKKGGGCGSRSDEFFSRMSATCKFSSASPVHLRLPKEEGECCMLSSSGDEEMCSSSGLGCTGAGCSRGCPPASSSADTSMKCSPRRPDSCCTSESVRDSQMKSQTATEEETSDDDNAFLEEGHCSPTKVQRQPFQQIQERQYSTSTTEGSASAQVTPSAIGTESGAGVYGKNGRQRFFGSGEQDGGLQALPELSESCSPQPRRFSAPFVESSPTLELAPVPVASSQATIPQQMHRQQQQEQEQARVLLQSASSGSNGSGSGSGGSGASTQTVIGMAQTATTTAQIGTSSLEPFVGTFSQQQIAGGRGTSAGVVRRRSWRTHYTRPKNKSLDSESASAKEEITPSSQSTPLRRSPPASLFSRRHSSNGAATTSAAEKQPVSQAAQPQTQSQQQQPMTTSATSRKALIRRKSLGNGGGSTKSKPPVQTRRSTQI